jgi:hypothetical protein
MIRSLFSQTISKDLLNRYKNIFITVFNTFKLFKLINMLVSSKLVYEIVLKVFLNPLLLLERTIVVGELGETTDQ